MVGLHLFLPVSWTSDRAVTSGSTLASNLELVAAALLIYARYLDLETDLPCPAEVLAERLSLRVPTLDVLANAVVATRHGMDSIKPMLRG